MPFTAFKQSETKFLVLSVRSTSARH